MACENCSYKNERTAENGWFYDQKFGTKIQIVKFPAPTISLNRA
ncbi:MAG: hypothetical protein V1836_01570 [Candidatus Aenigmatarchaeota archaeon]